MSLNQFLIIVFARWRVGATVWLLTVALVVGVSLMLRPQYTASASVMVDVRSQDPVAGGALVGAAAQNYMVTQVDVVQSERVALRALRSLRIHENAELRSEWLEATGGKGNFESWLAELILKKFDVRPARDSNVMTLAYTSPDPGLSAAMANALMHAYIETTLELRVEPARQNNAFFDDRAKQLREALGRAQAKHSAYQQQKGLLATDERVDIEHTRLAELSSQVVSLQAATAQSGGRQGQARANVDRLQEVLNNPVVSALSADLSRQQARLKEVGERLGDLHPQVIELRSGIAELRARLDDATRRASGSVGVDNAVNQSRLAQAQRALDEQRSKVLRLKARRDEASVLLRDVESAQRTYDAVLARVSQTAMESQVTQTNVSILKRAVEPAFASFPRIGLNAATAAVLGAFLALGACLVREQFDRRMRTEEDVVNGLRQPLLLALPRADREDPSGATRVRQIKSRVLSGLPRSAAG